MRQPRAHSSIADAATMNFLAFGIHGPHDFSQERNCDGASPQQRAILAAKQPNDAVASAITYAGDSVASMPSGTFDPAAGKIAKDDSDGGWAVA